jgi:hypothetical protein
MHSWRAVWAAVAVVCGGAAAAGEPAVRFAQSAAEVPAYDFVELTAEVPAAEGGNPFLAASLSGEFARHGEAPQRVEGFCDAADGSVYRVRFMPAQPGTYRFRAEWRRGARVEAYDGTFLALAAGRKGLVRVDAEHPWHFVWEGTGEHYFWNGTTTYWLLGWNDEQVIEQAIDRLARLKVNRIRVALSGRTSDGRRWDEPLVVNTERFRFRLNPWVAKQPDSVEQPGFDVSRFNLEFWRKCERMLRRARERDLVVSLLFFLDGRDAGADPYGKARAGSEEEQRYYRYAVARCGAYSNVMWDVTNEYHLFRTEPWVEQMGGLLKRVDPYQHLTSVHGDADYRFRRSDWSDFAMYQSWDEAGGHAFMLQMRQAQARTGRPMPQVNEEYGYEDHYPTRWGGGRKAPSRSADNRRRLAWGMYLAGGYQTTGERADRGTGAGADSGGGWINGRGDDAMTMLQGYAHLAACFGRLQWWKMEPHDELVDGGHYCLAEPGRQYLVYLPAGGRAHVELAQGRYRAEWFNPRTGEVLPIGPVRGPRWTSPAAADEEDWAVLLVGE